MNSTAFPIRPTQKEKAPANSEALDTGLLETENAAERVPESEAAKWALNMFLSNHELHPFRDINEIDQLKQRPIPDPAALCQGSYVDLRSLEDICRERYDDQGKPKGKMNSTQGKILCMLHIRLICKHVDLYCACRASNATKALRRIPGKYQILSRLWREGIQKPLDGLRLFPVAHKLLNRFIDTIYPLLVTLSRESRGPPEERTQEEGTPKMHTSEEGIHQRKSSQKDLSKEGPSQESTHKEDPSAEENIIAEILGDVSRYRYIPPPPLSHLVPFSPLVFLANSQQESIRDRQKQGLELADSIYQLVRKGGYRDSGARPDLAPYRCRVESRGHSAAVLVREERIRLGPFRRRCYEQVTRIDTLFHRQHRMFATDS